MAVPRLAHRITFAALAAWGIPPCAAAQEPSPPEPIGRWVLVQESGENPFRGATVQFGADGSFTLAQRGEEWIAGAYRLEGDRLTFVDRTGRFACLWDDGSAKVGAYAWAVSDGRMRLELIADECDKRAETLAISWFARPEGDGK